MRREAEHEAVDDDDSDDDNYISNNSNDFNNTNFIDARRYYEFNMSNLVENFRRID